MAREQSFVRFIGDANDFYQSINDPQSVVGLWEQLTYIADNPEVDDEVTFEFPTEDDLYKILYGPPYTLLFKNLLDGTLAVYSILHPSF